jgi:segregation and condensation protein A
MWGEESISPEADERLNLDIGGFEGPLDLLLHLAREQKVDLLQISVLELAEQYLVFVERARVLRLDLAADYLVMAAWLAFLKSRLLLPPEPGDDGPSAEDLAAHLAFQLERLQAMRDASPTGGALGQGSDSENRLLQQSAFASSRTQSEAKFRESLKTYLKLLRESKGRVEKAYERTYGTRFAPPRAPAAAPAASSGRKTPTRTAGGATVTDW